MNNFYFFSLLVLAVTVSCTSKSGSNETATKPKARDAGQAVVSEAAKELSSNLSSAISEDGVSHAIKFCNAEAMPLTQQLSEKFGVDIKRATHKPRNPANLADVEELQVIKKWQSQLESGEDIKSVLNKRQRHYEYYAPIRINNPLCLKCHGQRGTDISPENTELLSTLYQGDRATGFKMGDIRGMWAITMPVDSAKISAIKKNVQQKEIK